MNEYAVVKVQVKENQKMSFTYRPETAGVSTLCRKIFFYYGQIDNDGNSPVVFQGK